MAEASDAEPKKLYVLEKARAAAPPRARRACVRAG
jgi:hypothetical protein